jgi:hypothetical protein
LDVNLFERDYTDGRHIIPEMLENLITSLISVGLKKRSGIIPLPPFFAFQPDG